MACQGAFHPKTAFKHLTALSNHESLDSMPASTGRMILGALILVAIPVALALLSPSKSACPPSFQLNPKRSAQLLQLLESTEEGQAILQDVAHLPKDVQPAYCFGSISIPSVTDRHAVLLNASHPLAESASRLGHLLTHITGEMPMQKTAGDCEAQVDRALSREAKAFEVELKLRKELGVGLPHAPRPALPFEFEAEFWKTPESERESLIKRYLIAHPDGAPGVDALASSYKKRCATQAK